MEWNAFPTLCHSFHHVHTEIPGPLPGKRDAPGLFLALPGPSPRENHNAWEQGPAVQGWMCISPLLI
jgi:hypothetical protein